MWENIVYVLLVAEGLILFRFIWEWARKKKKNSSILFLFLAFLANFALYLIPYAHTVLTAEEPVWSVLSILQCMSNGIKAFVGEWEPSAVEEFTKTVPLFAWAYALGTLLAPLATVNAAVQAFSFAFRNNIRLFFALHKKSCDIVLGSGEKALRYAKNGAAVLLPEPQLDRDATLQLVERGYVVLRRDFTKELLAGRRLPRTTRYNIICPGTAEENLEHINTFIAYHKQERVNKRLRLYVELEGEKGHTIRREIIDKSCCKDSIFPFSSNELLARRFAEEHPITQYLPRPFIEEDTSIRNDSEVGVIYMGFGALNQEMFAHSVLNDQLVAFENGEYVQKPLHYHLFDLDIDEQAWLIGGMKTALQKLCRTPKLYYPLPSLPYTVTVHDCAPGSDRAVDTVCDILQQKNAFHYVIVDTGDMYQNIEIGTRLRSLLGDSDGYHVFIRSETAYIEDDAQITYMGDIDDVFTHSFIVNDELSRMAYKLNEIYTVRRMMAGVTEKRAERLKQAEKQAEKDWANMNRFRRYSNLYAALNLRLKLQLLGLDYTKASGRKSDGLALSDYYAVDLSKHVYADYFVRSKRNAMLAQEKYRWNIYHLSEKVLPLPKEKVVAVKNAATGEVSMYTRTDPLTHHACVTSYVGLDELSRDLCAKKCAAGVPCTVEDFDYYKHDDQQLTVASELFKELGYVLVKKDDIAR